MRDVIWTLIVVWLIYKLVDIFKSSPKKSYVNNSANQNMQDDQTNTSANFTAKKVPKEAIQKSADKEGDYVDFEEIK
ncbi:MAG: DUF4834 family protein [Bacteroidetes bacterium]|nr:DUF4834 family protein [Bacteroidota bacterium]